MVWGVKTWVFNRGACGGEVPVLGTENALLSTDVITDLTSKAARESTPRKASLVLFGDRYYTPS